MPTDAVDGLEASVVSLNVSDTDQYPRRTHLRLIEQKYQAQWEESKVFQANPDPSKESFFVTFPYPYMNGKIHIGHAFSMSKAEFQAGFQRLIGKNVLWPFAFHCTGMPIQAAANNLKKEIEKYGNPPVFPSDEELAAAKAAAEATKSDGQSVEQMAAKAEAAKSKGKKTKLTAKKNVWWWETLLRSGVPEELIPNFTDAEYWLQYFPGHAIDDLKSFGLGVDWRRSFITTPTNPFYSNFIEWQFRTLRKRNVIDFGTRPTIYSTSMKQACMDHDRSGAYEGIGPQEYTLIKILIKDNRGKLAVFEDKKVFLVAATLRPETMYGQTNCFVLPDGEYGVYESPIKGEYFVCSARSALNMAYQFVDPVSEEWGKVNCLATVMGHDLLGLPLSAPNAKYETVYCLPLLTISMGKGTGVVTSVPSDAPDDYAALMDLKNKDKLREKYGITEEMVLPFEVVPIIEVEGFGSTAAVAACEKYKIKSQNDKDKLVTAKKEVYLAGFTKGVMLVGSQKGKLVSEAKPIVKKEMIDSGLALSYFEPESLCLSREGDECVVAQLPQWYIKYGEESWKQRVIAFVSSDEFNAFTPLCQDQFIHTLNWLGEWACSRSFGLGTRVPWDTDFVIESLSDSTIYFAYYTIAHYLQGESNLDGSKGSPSGFEASKLDDAFWDYLYLDGEFPGAKYGADSETIEKMRDEFKYWYPMNMRCSGKDLIKNHLTMSLYNHAAIWDKDDSMLPRSFFTNGMVVVNGEKMSKSIGNFLILEESTRGDYHNPEGESMSWTADTTRFALACAGDGLEDANFDTKIATTTILELFTEDSWLSELMTSLKSGELRTGGSETYDFMDKVFFNNIAACAAGAYENYLSMRYRDAVKFAYYNLRRARDVYRDSFARSGEPMHADILKLYLETIAIIMAPVTPHFCEHIWQHHLGNQSSVLLQSWPMELHDKLDAAFLAGSNYLFSQRASFLSLQVKMKLKSNITYRTANIYISKTYPPAKQAVLRILQSEYKSMNKSFPVSKTPEAKALMGRLTMQFKQAPEIGASKKESGNAMKFASYTMDQTREIGEEALRLEPLFDEEQVFRDNLAYIRESLQLEELNVYDVAAGPDAVPDLDQVMTGNQAVEPCNPRIVFYQ